MNIFTLCNVVHLGLLIGEAVSGLLGVYSLSGMEEGGERTLARK
jgi:hypothetical protein